MRKTILLALIGSIFLSCEESAVKIRDVIPYEKETYEVVAFCLSQRESVDKDGNLPDRLTNVPYYDSDHLVASIEKAFPKQDLHHIQRQLTDSTSFRLHPKKLLADINLISKDTIDKMFRESEKANSGKLFWEQYHKRYGEKTLITISKPVFSKKGNIAIVSLGYSYGSLSGFGQLLSLEKTSKGWKIKKVLSMWIS